MTGSFYLLAETDHARRFTTDPQKLARAFWVPRAVCKDLTLFPPQTVCGRALRRCFVEIEDGWWEQHFHPDEAARSASLPAAGNPPGKERA